jgi:hypothetical protein
MTHIQEVIRLEPSGAVVPAQVVRVRRETDGSTIAAGVTDANGEVEYIVDGHPGPYYLHVEDIPGGDKYWHSHDATGAGALTFLEIPYGLRVLGDGVVPGYEDELYATTSGASTISMAAGACVVAGHVVVNYVVDVFTVSRPASITRLDRLVCRLYPDTASVTPGKAEFGLLAGNTDGTAVDLTQTSEVYEVGLGVVTVPVAAPISFSDSRSFAGLGAQPVTGVARDDSVTTTSVGGEALSGLSVSLDLTRTTMYDISAELTARQTDVVSASSPDTWIATVFGSTGSGNTQFNEPRQVAVDAAGNTYTADKGNDRAIIRDSAGTYVGKVTRNNCTGVAVDSSGNIYVGGTTVVQSYTSGLVLRWTRTATGWGVYHLATDGTYVYLADQNNNIVRRILASDGTGTTILVANGSSDGEVQDPHGIFTDGTNLWVTDWTKENVQKFLIDGTYVSKFGSSGSGNGQFTNPTGIVVQADGDIWVADQGNDRLQKFDSGGVYVEQFAATDPDGVVVHTADDKLWVTDFTNDTLSLWDFTAAVIAPGGYGEVAVSIDGNLSAYIGRGNEVGDVGNAHTRSVQGPASVTVAAYGKRTSETLTLESAVLSAKAVPRR